MIGVLSSRQSVAQGVEMRSAVPRFIYSSIAQNLSFAAAAFVGLRVTPSMIPAGGDWATRHFRA